MKLQTKLSWLRVLWLTVYKQLQYTLRRDSHADVAFKIY